MSRATTPRIIVVSAMLIVLVLNAVVFGGRLFSWVTGTTVAAVSAVTRRISDARGLLSTAAQRIDLAARVRELEESNARLEAGLLQVEQMQRDIEFYRDAAALSPRPSRQRVEAGIFSYSSVVGVRQAVLNRGSADGLVVGDVVMTARSELVGVVQAVFAHHAVVRRVQDVAFEVTAQIAGSDIAGLARSDGKGSLLLDLVQKNERVEEGMRIVTSGDDRFPAGLIIGTVRSVDDDAATLFQIVRVAPAIADAIHGSVLVIHL